jgi:hypothetical protein
MNHRQVALPQVGRVTRQNTSTGQHRQAPGRLSRALFTTQSATHFDLVPSGSPPRRGPRKGDRTKADQAPANSRSPSQARGISSNRLCGGERKPAYGAATCPAVLLSRPGLLGPRSDLRKRSGTRHAGSPPGRACNVWQGAGAVPDMLRLWAFRCAYAGDRCPGGIGVRYHGGRPTLVCSVDACAHVRPLCVPVVIVDRDAGP